MEQVTPSISAPTDDDVDLLAVFDGDGILPSRLLPQRWMAIPPQNLERSQMRMHRMEHRPAKERTIDKPPYLDVAEFRIGVDADGVELFVVDHPLNAGRNADGGSAVEYERPRPHRLLPLQRLELGEPFWNPAGVPFYANDVETHDAAERSVGALVEQDDAGADRIDRKVDHDFGPLSHRQPNARQRRR